jgi:hypothetical protein
MLLFVSTSCSNSTVETISESTIQTEAQTEPAIEYKTIEPPEDGWTLELLSEVTYINGKKVDLPFSLNDIGWEEPLYYSEYDEKYNTYYHVLTPPDENDEDKLGPLFMSIGAFGNDDTTFDNDCLIFITQIDAPIKEKYSEVDDIIVINGVRFGDSKDDVTKKMGQPNRDTSSDYTYMYYINDDNYIHLAFSLDFQLDRIMISVNLEEEK